MKKCHWSSWSWATSEGKLGLQKNVLQKSDHFKLAGTILKHVHLSTLTWGVVRHVWIDDYSSHSFIHLLYLVSPALRVTGFFFAVAYQFSSISYLRAKAESSPGQLTSVMLMQSGRDSCAFLCVIAFLVVVFFFLGRGFLNTKFGATLHARLTAPVRLKGAPLPGFLPPLCFQVYSFCSGPFLSASVSILSQSSYSDVEVEWGSWLSFCYFRSHSSWSLNCNL